MIENNILNKLILDKSISGNNPFTVLKTNVDNVRDVNTIPYVENQLIIQEINNKKAKLYYDYKNNARIQIFDELKVFYLMNKRNLVDNNGKDIITGSSFDIECNDLSVTGEEINSRLEDMYDVTKGSLVVCKESNLISIVEMVDYSTSKITCKVIYQPQKLYWDDDYDAQ